MDLDEALRLYNEGHPNAKAALSRRAQGELVLALAGELDMKASSDVAPLLEAALLECAARGRLVLDLSCVGYVSSTGVGLLSTLMVKAGRRTVTLVLLDIPPRVRAIMDALGLLSFFNVEGSGA